MTRIAGASVLFLMVATAAGCGVGGDDHPGNGSGSDDPNDKLGIVCNATMNITGTFAPGTPGRPNDAETGQPIMGCWPVGTWTFTAQVAMNGCPTAPALQDSYSFRVDRMDPDGTGYVESYTYLTAAANMQYHVHVSSGGGGDCEGGLEIGSADGTEYWNLQPNQLNNTLNGQGEYIKYKKDSWPWTTN